MSDLSNIVDKATDAIVNGQALSTDNLNDLAKIFYASANRIIEAIDKSAGLHREIVQQLPTQDIDDNTIYMVLDSSASGSDVYDEWMWIENAWEHIGSTRVDLTDYYNKTQIDTALSGKANAATTLSGYGITDAYTKTEVDTSLSGKASTSDIPTALSSLSEDTTHRLVTDTEKSTWNGKGDKPVFTDSKKNGSFCIFYGKSYNKLFESLPAGKYLITGVYNGSNLPTCCHLTTKDTDFNNNSLGQLGVCGGVLYVELSAASDIYLYIQTGDTNQYTYYGCKFTAVKLD